MGCTFLHLKVRSNSVLSEHVRVSSTDEENQLAPEVDYSTDYIQTGSRCRLCPTPKAQTKIYKLIII